jgi:hypothetical protein
MQEISRENKRKRAKSAVIFADPGAGAASAGNICLKPPGFQPINTV